MVTGVAPGSLDLNFFSFFSKTTFNFQNRSVEEQAYIQL
jgi:hypothetical protein